jgi:hypothetical protein
MIDIKVWGSMAIAMVVLTGCEGDDITFAPEAGTDAGDAGPLKDGTVHESGGGDATGDVAHDAIADADAGAVPQRVLVTQNNSSTSELVAVNVATHKIDGTLTFTGDLGTTDAHSKLFPFLLEQSNNIVARLDAVTPWVIDSSWNVNEKLEGGYPYTDPYAAVVAAAGSTYVLLYNRNEIVVLNDLQTVEAGPPLSTIDLSSLVQAKGDGTVEATAGVFVAASSTLYVVLANINQNTVAPPSYDLLCTGTTSTVLGIDTKSNKIKDLGGTGPGGAIALKGFDPVFDGLVYDQANERLLILEAGCNSPGDAGDGGPGPIAQRGVEAVHLSDGSTSILIDTGAAFPTGAGYPSGIVYMTDTSAVLGFDYTGSEVYAWNPMTTTLGAPIKNAPDQFTYDGAGNLLGTSTTYDDGGSTTNVIKTNIATSTQTVLYTQPFTTPGGIIGGVDVWPHP